MSNSTETFWEVDGVSLQTHAFNITTLGGDRMAPPPVRGDDLRVPYLPGSVFVPRVPDARTITLGMWVIGANEDGTIPQDETLRRTFERNWRKLRQLLWTPRRQFTLTKRFWVLTEELEDGGVDTTLLPKDGLWSLYTATAKGTYAGGLTPTMNGAARAVFTVDILLSDPYFYGDFVAVEFSTQTGEGYPGPTQAIDVLGDDRTTAIEVEFAGPLTSGQMNNASEPSLWVRYSSYVPPDETAVVRVRDFSATHYAIGSSYPASGYVAHDGDHFWLYLDPGPATLALTTQAGTGSAILRYQPRWF